MWIRSFSLLTILGFVATCGVGSSVRGDTLEEDFESYEPGTFPAPTWIDVGSLDPTPPNPPDPSVTVEVTTAPSGEGTQALATSGWIGASPRDGSQHGWRGRWPR